MEPDDASIDHKERLGEHRERVRSVVFAAVGARGEPVTSREQVVGDWQAYFLGLAGERVEPPWVYRFAADGSATNETPSDPPSRGDRWDLNADGSLSYWTWCASNPDFDLPESTLGEERMHVAALPSGRLVLWNGDASLVQLLTPLTRLQP